MYDDDIDLVGNKEYCLISKEVVILIEWLITYDSKLVERLIKKVWKKGFEKVYLDHKNKSYRLEEYTAQQTILDFFYLLDSTLGTIVEKEEYNAKSKNNFIFDTVTSEIELEKKISKDSLSNLLLNKSNEDDLEKKEKMHQYFKNFLQNWDPCNSIAE